jgi:hypothetical protein
MGIRHVPISSKLSLDLDNILDSLAKEYHVRINRINERVKQIKMANQRRPVEYVLRASGK